MSDLDPLVLLHDTLAAYERLREKAIHEARPSEKAEAREEWPELSLVAVATRAEVGLTTERVWKRLNDHACTSGAQGWVRYRSRRAIFGATDSLPLPVTGDAEAGPPLAAEWTEGPDTSGQLRFDQPSGGFTLWRYAERPLGAADVIHSSEIPALRQIVWVLAHPAPENPAEGAAIPCLTYHVFWGAGPEDRDPSALRRLFARFAGFDARPDRLRVTRTRADRES